MIDHSRPHKETRWPSCCCFTTRRVKPPASTPSRTRCARPATPSTHRISSTAAPSRQSMRAWRTRRSSAFPTRSSPAGSVPRALCRPSSSAAGRRAYRCRSTAWTTTPCSSARATSTRPGRSSTPPTTPSCSSIPATSTTSPTRACPPTTPTQRRYSHNACSTSSARMDDPSRRELEAAHCWEADDRVPGRPQMTAFRRRLRLHQARWREAQRHPIGTQPIVPRKGTATRPVGSRLPLAYAQETGANFLTAGALAAARTRASSPERHQRFDQQRLCADLLWSPTLAFNLFGDLAADLSLADRAVHAWWPDAPGTVSAIRFAHSPGRFDPTYLGSLRSFDAAFVLDLGDGTEGIVGVVTAYHEVNRRQPPKPKRLPRYREITDRSGFFGPGAIDAVSGTELIHIWLDHLLVLSMLQHPSGAWRWGRLVVVHPVGNSDFAGACTRYSDLLVDRSTFSSVTLEELLDADALPPQTAAALGDRYVLR